MLFSSNFFDRDFFDDLFDWDFSIPRAFQNFRTFSFRTTYPAFNVYEDDSAYFITAELPGISKKDLKIEIAGNTLSIEAKREQPKPDKKNNYYRTERFSGEFKRSFSLNDSINTANIKAELANGILLITLPKAEEVKPKAIEVK